MSMAQTGTELLLMQENQQLKQENQRLRELLNYIAERAETRFHRFQGEDFAEEIYTKIFNLTRAKLAQNKE